MGKIKETDYTDFDEELLDEEEDFIDSDLAEDEEEDLLGDAVDPRFKRTWRDAEKYKEIRELYKIINDDLYTGFDEDALQDEEEKE